MVPGSMHLQLLQLLIVFVKKKLLQTAPNCFKKTAPKDFLYLPSPYKTLKRLPQKTKVSKPK